ncbi:MAG TPA: recombinase family protein [Anaerolineae bacterium]|nr:recombinase family protein [Anaerolineae bacterium]
MNKDTDHQRPERAALYARISTDKIALQGDNFSIEAQLVEMRTFVQNHHWEVVAEFLDVGVSGTSTDRPGLNAMKAAAAAGAFDILVVHELSRLSRSSVYETFAIFEYLGRYQVGFISVKDPKFDLTSINGRFMLSILATVNQYYVDLLRMHTQKGKHQRAREGLYNASTIPYGYQLTGDSKTPPVIVPAEAEVVRQIFERYATGRYSVQELADYLNAQGHQTRKGLGFAKDTIADMLRNRFYTGKVVYKAGSHDQQVGEVYPGQHPAIISEGLWEACHKIRSQHRGTARAAQPQVRPYMLGQLVYCHYCQRRLRCQDSSTGGYYREVSKARGFTDCPAASRSGTRVLPLHAQMSRIVKQLHLPPDWQDELATLIGEDEEVATCDDRRARLIAERRRLKQDRQRGVYDDDDDLFYRELERLRRELDLLPAPDELAQLRLAAQQVASLQDIWDTAGEADQRDLMQLMFRRVLVDVPQGRLVLLYPSAPFIPLFRTVSLLQERELGEFVPIWPPTHLPELSYPQLPPLTQLPQPVANLPFLPTWPWEAPPQQRISESLSAALKQRRRQGWSGGCAVTVAHQGMPELQLDQRKWPDVTLRSFTLAEALRQPAGSLVFLDTPLRVQVYPDRQQLFQRVHTVLAEGGIWHWLDVAPVSMPAHWLFTYFPAIWGYAREVYGSSQQLFTQLRALGFQVTVEEHTFYQPVTLEVAAQIAEQRPGLLQLVDAAIYEQGLERLHYEVHTRGGTTVIGSEVTLVKVTASKPAATEHRPESEE